MVKDMSDLPIELHAEIIKGLHHYRDRSTLLSAAMVNKEWCKASQRILFSTVTDNWHSHDNAERKDRVMLTHMRFLRTIADYPRRLGPLVNTYAQHLIACNPTSTRVPGFPKSYYKLWKLTDKVLPAMVNLRHLYLEPAIESWDSDEDEEISSSTLLHGCAFQLKTLIWRSYYHPQKGLAKFLGTQRDLIHLENRLSPNRENLLWLEDDVCPNLISVSCGFKSLAHVARSRDIIAWTWYIGSNNAELVPHDLSVLNSLKYLSVYNYKFFREIVGSIDLKITLLQLNAGSWDTGTLASLSNMPSLRVLVVIHKLHSKHSDQEIVQCAIGVFKKLSTVKYIIQRYLRPSESGNNYHNVRLSLSRDASHGILCEDMDIDDHVATVWWTLYDI